MGSSPVEVDLFAVVFDFFVVKRHISLNPNPINFRVFCFFFVSSFSHCSDLFFFFASETSSSLSFPEHNIAVTCLRFANETGTKGTEKTFC